MALIFGTVVPAADPVVRRCNTGQSFRWWRGAAGRTGCGSPKHWTWTSGTSGRHEPRGPASSHRGTEKRFNDAVSWIPDTKTALLAVTVILLRSLKNPVGKLGMRAHKFILFIIITVG